MSTKVQCRYLDKRSLLKPRRGKENNEVDGEWVGLADVSMIVPAFGRDPSQPSILANQSRGLVVYICTYIAV